MEVIRRFADRVHEKFDTLVPGGEEAQLAGPVEALLRDVGTAFGFDVRVRNESPAEEVGGRPDFGVAVDRLLAGHLELKKPGTGARTRGFRDHNRDQWNRFKALPNLVYTDGSEWALYRTGVQIGTTVALGDVRETGAMAVDPDDAQELTVAAPEVVWSFDFVDTGISGEASNSAEVFLPAWTIDEVKEQCVR